MNTIHLVDLSCSASFSCTDCNLHDEVAIETVHFTYRHKKPGSPFVKVVSADAELPADLTCPECGRTARIGKGSLEKIATYSENALLPTIDISRLQF